MNFVGPGVTVTDAGSGVATVTIPSSGAVIADSGSTSQNVRTNRSPSQSPIDNTKDGIVNMSSRTTGATTGATGDYSTISGGDQNIASGDNSTVVGGLLNTSSGASSVSGGSTCTASGTAAVALGLSATASGNQSFASGSGVTASGAASFAAGASSSATGDNSVAVGLFCTAGGDSSVAVGLNLSAAGDRSIALGANASAARHGEMAHSAGNGNTDGFHAVDLYSGASAAPVNLLLGDATEISLSESKVYSIRVRIVGNLVGAPGRSHSVHEILAQSDLGVLTIYDDFTVTEMSSLGWTMEVSAPGGATLRVRCDPGADNVNFGARVEWTAVSAPS